MAAFVQPAPKFRGHVEQSFGFFESESLSFFTPPELPQPDAGQFLSPRSRPGQIYQTAL